MSTYNILFYDNGVGLKTDAELLHDLFIKNNIKSKKIILHHEFTANNKSDIGIWIQNFIEEKLDQFKLNIFYINEEWSHREIDVLSKFDIILCKNKYAYNLFKDRLTTVYLPFFSKNLKSNVKVESDKILHFAGKSIQKNSEATIKNINNLTIIDPNNRLSEFKNKNFKYNHITNYISDEKLKNILNSHPIHVCCSLYESWGHYLFEGLSTGSEIICSEIPVFTENLDPDLVHFLPVEDYTDESYTYCKDNKDGIYQYRKSLFIKESDLIEKIKNFESKGSPEKRINLFNHIMEKNKNETLKFFKTV